MLADGLGWIAQWDPNYQKWFYVNEKSSDKAATWEHPGGTGSLFSLRSQEMFVNLGR